MKQECEENNIGLNLVSDGIWIQPEDANHHLKYFGTGGRGKTRLLVLESKVAAQAPFVPSPVDVVSLGIEPVSYLIAFPKNSSHYESCQAMLNQIMGEIETKLGEFGAMLLVQPMMTTNEVEFNVMLGCVEDVLWLRCLEGKTFDEQRQLLADHLEIN